MAFGIEAVKALGVAVDVDALASNGFESLSEADRYRLKTQGICAQRQVGLFMVRVRVPGGKISPVQLRRVAELAERYGRDQLHVTTRGGLEIHHVKIEDAARVLDGLSMVGLSTKGSCGDTVRNVVACSHAGTYAGEILPLEPFVRMVHQHIVAISDETNIARKFNVAFACSPLCDEAVATSDIGFVATAAPDFGDAGFALWGAGGLGATPRLATPLVDFIDQIDVLPAFMALMRISEKYGDRTDRAKAKNKLLVERWGAEHFRALFLDEFEAARALDLPELRVVSPSSPARNGGPPRIGDVHEQKQRGRFTVPVLIPLGELKTASAVALAAIAEAFGDGTVHLTADQNAELQGIRKSQVAETLAALGAAGLMTRGRGGIADVVSCVGMDFCTLAVAGSMSLGEEIRAAMEVRRTDERYADFRIRISGCPHSCAKHQIADIGLSGGKSEAGGESRETFTFYLGGNAHERRLGAAYPSPVPRERVLLAIASLLALYERRALDGERFSQTVARVGEEQFFAAIGETLSPMAGSVCACAGISREAVATAIESGARDIAAIGRATGAGTACGNCRGELASLVIGADEESAFARLLAGRLKQRLQAALEAPRAQRADALRRLAGEMEAAATLLGG